MPRCAQVRRSKTWARARGVCACWLRNAAAHKSIIAFVDTIRRKRCGDVASFRYTAIKFAESLLPVHMQDSWYTAARTCASQCAVFSPSDNTTRPAHLSPAPQAARAIIHPHPATGLPVARTCFSTPRRRNSFVRMLLGVATILALGAAASPVNLEAAAGFEAVASKLAGKPSKSPEVVKSRLKLVKLHCTVLTRTPWAAVSCAVRTGHDVTGLLRTERTCEAQGSSPRGHRGTCTVRVHGTAYRGTTQVLQYRRAEPAAHDSH